MARGALPLGFGLLCSFGAQPPAAARAPCLLLADVPFLPPEGPEPPAPHVLLTLLLLLLCYPGWVL